MDRSWTMPLIARLGEPSLGVTERAEIVRTLPQRDRLFTRGSSSAAIRSPRTAHVRPRWLLFAEVAERARFGCLSRRSNAAYDAWPTDPSSKRTSLKGGEFGRSSRSFWDEHPEYRYPPDLVTSEPVEASKAALAAEAARPASEGTRAERLKALIPSHRVKNVAKVLDIKPLNRANDLLIADIVAATADSAKIDAKTAAKLMAAAQQAKKTKQDFIEAFGVPGAH